MNKRKFFGTIIGVIFWSICVVYFTYAYYEWKSINTNVVLGIQDLATQCNKGPNVNVSNIGPIFYPSDGVKVKFSLTNDLMTTQNFSIQLNITSISDNLLVDDFKWILIKEEDYDEPIVEGDFSNFVVGTNTITSSMTLDTSANNEYSFIVYIDGNMYNDPNIQNNSLNSYLEIGNCGIIKEPTLMNTSSTNDFRNEAYITNIKTASFVDYIDTTNASLDTDNNPIQWDMSTAQDNGVIAWLEPNTEEGYYDLYIGANDTIYANSLGYFFCGMTGLTNISFDNLDTSVTIHMNSMFEGCSSLTSLDLSSFDTSKVAGGQWTSMGAMFKGCSSLTTLDLSSFDTSNVVSMGGMFQNCSSLINLDISNFDTSKVIDIGGMFSYCEKIITIDLSNFDTSKVTTMSGIFSRCSALTNVNLSSFNTSNVTNMESMFQFCSSLKTLDLSNFDTSNVTSMSGMFQNCSSLTSLDLSNFDTSKVTSMHRMFWAAGGLTNLYLGNWDTSNVTTMSGMFYYTPKLTTTITIRNANVNWDSMYNSAASSKDADGNYIGQITINYIGDDTTTSDVNESTEALVNSMIEAADGNVVKGSLVA